jgi:hypothetical protein
MIDIFFLVIHGIFNLIPMSTISGKTGPGGIDVASSYLATLSVLPFRLYDQQIFWKTRTEGYIRRLKITVSGMVSLGDAAFPQVPSESGARDTNVEEQG